MEVAAGAGTITSEILEDAPDVDTVVVVVATPPVSLLVEDDAIVRARQRLWDNYRDRDPDGAG